MDVMDDTMYLFDDMEVDEDLLDDYGMEDMFSIDFGGGLTTLGNESVVRTAFPSLITPSVSGPSNLVRSCSTIL